VVLHNGFLCVLFVPQRSLRLQALDFRWLKIVIHHSPDPVFEEHDMKID